MKEGCWTYVKGEGWWWKGLEEISWKGVKQRLAGGLFYCAYVDCGCVETIRFVRLGDPDSRVNCWRVYA